MKIAIVTESFSENMGYAAMALPKALAALGHEVYVISSNTQVYYGEQFYKEVYEPFLGPNITACGEWKIDGYTLYRLPFRPYKNTVRLRGLFNKLRKLKPDIVQTFSVTAETTYQVALYKPILGYKLFTANHVVASIFPAAQRELIAKEAPAIQSASAPASQKQPVPVSAPKEKAQRKYSAKYFIYGFRNLFSRLKLINTMTTICYPATIDAADIAIRFFNVPKEKVRVIILGVDTDYFKPAITEEDKKERKLLREKIGCGDNDILCIYTGRFTQGKNPLCLARAVNELALAGKPYKALFIGNGPQQQEILSNKNCSVMPFMIFKELAKYYRAADIGIWPREESTSVLDATACGLPVVISDKVIATERKEGNGITYKENDHHDLARALDSLNDKPYREKLGKAGIEKIMKNHNWLKLAQMRVEDYNAALKS